jgi:hypothetical protein
MRWELVGSLFCDANKAVLFEYALVGGWGLIILLFPAFSGNFVLFSFCELFGIFLRFFFWVFGLEDWIYRVNFCDVL